MRSRAVAGLTSPNFSARSTLFGFQRPGGGVSTSPNTSWHFYTSSPSLHHFIPTVSKPSEGQRGRNTKLTWNFFTSTRSFLTSSPRLWDKLQQTVTSPFPTRDTLRACVSGLLSQRSEHPAGSPSYLSHPPVRAASCPDGSVPRWVSGLIGSGDRGGGYNRAVSASGKPGRCSSVSERKRSVRLISQWNCSKQRLTRWVRSQCRII